MTSTDYNDVPSKKSISYNEANGTVTYTYTFDHKGYSSGTTYNEFFDISFTTPNAAVNGNAGYLVGATINGRVVGLPAALNPNDFSDRYTNAKSGWSAISGAIYERVANEYTMIGGSKPALNSGVLTRTVGLDPIGGVITYSVTFDNRPTGADNTVALQEVTVEDNPRGSDVFAVQVIPGRIQGPIIQSIGTRTERRRTINVALTLRSQGSAWYTYGDITSPRTIASGIISGLMPAGTSYIAGDSDTWNWKNAFYTRTCSIVYPS